MTKGLKELFDTANETLFLSCVKVDSKRCVILKRKPPLYQTKFFKTMFTTILV